MADNNIVLGIDLGTSNSVACAYVDGEPKFIPSSEDLQTPGPSFPSCVAFIEGGVLVGESAKRRYVTHPDKVVMHIKKDMGKPEMKEYDGKSYSPQQITAFILGKIKNDAEEYLNKSIEDVIITVPANFDNNQRTATKDAARIAGLNVIDLINEPTAASLAYGFNNHENNSFQRILVFDLGAGTLDVTIMDCGDIFKVKATSGDNALGGTDMDYLLSEFLAKEFEKQHGVKLDRNNKINNRLIEAAERAKIELSSTDVTEVNLPFMAMDSSGNPLDLTATITRPELEELVRPIVERCQKPLQNALDDAGFTKKDIDKLILVGGPTRMPIVRDFVEDFMEINAERGVDPMSCVAQGAALKGSALNGSAVKRGESGEIVPIPPVDIVPLSLGVISDGNLTETIIKKGSEIPRTEHMRFETIEDNQESVKVEIVQGEYRIADQNTYLGLFDLSIKAAPQGSVTVDITFEIDESGILNVTAVDETTGNTKSIRLDYVNNMSESEIDEAIKQYEEVKIIDIRTANAIELILDAKEFINSNSLSSDEKDSINELISSLQDAIDAKNNIRISLGTNNLKDKLSELKKL